MSTTFSIAGRRYDVDDESTYVNLSSVNARELLKMLGLENDELLGEFRARGLVPRCKEVLRALRAQGDEGEEGVTEGRYHFAGRSPGLLTRRAKELLALCEKAGELGLITWG